MATHFYSTQTFLDLDLLEDFSVSPAFPQIDEGLFESKDCEDILESLLDNSTENKSATIDLDESIFSQQVEDENSGGCQDITLEKKDSAKSNAKDLKKVTL